MKIKNVRIRLFGKTVNRDYDDFSEELTVFHGKNESGKTTLKEFLRTTLFPVSDKKRYPETTGSEYGEVDCVTDSGEKFTVKRSANKTDSNRVMEAVSTGIDSQTYKGVYAMGPEELVNMAVVSSGDIRRRFLTVPGGENMPEITSSIAGEMDGLLSEKRVSRTKGIGLTMDELDSVSKKIGEAKRRESELNGLTAKKAEYKTDLESKRELQKESNAVNSKIDKYNDQKKSIDRLRELNVLIEKAAEADRSPENLEVFNGPSAKEKETGAQEKEAAEELEIAKRNLAGTDASLIMSRRNDIRELNENIGVYESAIRDLAALREKRPERVRSEEMRPATKGNYLPYIAFLCGAVAVAVAGIISNIIVLSVAGAVFAVLSTILIVKEKTKNNIESVAEPYVDADTDRRISDMESEIERLEDLLDRTASGILSKRTAFGNDVRTLSGCLSECGTVERATARFNEAATKHAIALDDLNEYLAPYGSEEELRRLYSLKLDRDRNRVEAEKIEEILNNAGITSEDVPSEPAHDFSREIEELVKEIARTDSEIKAILSDTDIERLYDTEASLKTKLDRQIREWLVLSAERSLADNACETIYEKMQPGVIETADRYLGMMTDGRYRMDTDPRERNVAVREGSERKTDSRWSSGLAAQVCLSLKLAVAKELSKEKLPVLLDDVLLVFDSERKMGACRAIAEAAKDMQIILFTCDDETADFMRSVGADVRGMDA